MEIDENILTILGVLAGVLILSGWVEQIIKGYKTKSMNDISNYLMILISAGALLWLLYGIIVEDIFIIGTNIAAVILMMAVLVMKQRYGKLKIPNSPNSKVKNPKKLILMDDNIKTVNGNINEIKMSTLLALFNNNLCNSSFMSRNM